MEYTFSKNLSGMLWPRLSNLRDIEQKINSINSLYYRPYVIIHWNISVKWEKMQERQYPYEGFILHLKGFTRYTFLNI